ncbi:hypothetical protein ABT093_20180 [Kitasatospora sp. NPDC002551]|uniref:hypothetical protein n=1 Tax=Kitasatospora sp. NPDC002551 TaxID=3154539 RepID=UPI0033205161
MTTTPARLLGDPFADGLLQAITTSAGRHHARLDTARTLPHTAYTGQLNVTSTASVRSTVFAPESTRARTALYLGTLSDSQWNDAAATLAARPQPLAAILSGRVHPDLLDPAHTAGHCLLPAGVGFECSAHPPTAADPDGLLCEHAAILAHALVNRVRHQPTALLAIRGCSLSRLAAKMRTALSTGRTAATPAPAFPPAADDPQPVGSPTDPVRADDAYSLWQARTPAHSDAEPVLPAVSPLPVPPPQVTPGIEALLADAAQRARAILDGAPVADLDALTDTIRYLATPIGAPSLENVASRLNRPVADVRRLVLAQRHGGPAGVHAADGPLPADPAVVDRALADIIAAQPTARGSLQADGNRITNDHAGVQLRLGPDSRWHPFVAGLTGAWQPAPGPSADAVAAYRAARTTRLARPR